MVEIFHTIGRHPHVPISTKNEIHQSTSPNLESRLFWKYSTGKGSVGGAAYVSPNNHHVGRTLRGNQSRRENNSGGTR